MRDSLETLKGKKNLIGCEVGVDKAENATDMLQNLDIKQLYLVDVWGMPDSGKDVRTLKIAQANVSGYNAEIIWLIKKSEDVTDEEIPLLSLDFVYIDGDHRYHAVKKDLENYWPRVKLGGLFAGHDYGNRNVHKAVHEFCEYREVLSHPTRTGDWWVLK